MAHAAAVPQPAGARERREMIARRLLATSAAIAVTAAVSVCLAAQPPASPQPPPPENPTFRTRAAGVRIDVLVTDDERPVPGLTEADFELTDQDVPQQFEVRRLHDLPVDVIIVLDNSTSLGRDGLDNLMLATDKLITRLNPQDRAALVTFSQVVVLRSRLTTDTESVREMVRRLK